ncbi:hypothetical protein Esti_006722 [Eimeria stiedai]
MTESAATCNTASEAEARPVRVCGKPAAACSERGGGSLVPEVSSSSPPPSTASPPASFNPRRFIRLVLVTGLLAAIASVFGKLAFDFSPRAAVQIFSTQLAQRLLPRDALEHTSSSSSSIRLRIGSVVLEANPEGFPALLQNVWKALLLVTAGHSSSSSSSPLSGSSSAGSSSVSIFVANFLSSVLLSWLLLGEPLTLRFSFGAACMLAGVVLLSRQRPPPPVTSGPS